MKRILCSVAVVATVISCHAGSFGGPPPFTNGSPLITGVDGSYQAVARGENLTGVFRFAYSQGNQTSTDDTDGQVSNRYVFFVEGLPFVGPVTANIMGSTLAGVLEMNTPTSASGHTNSFENTRMSGDFNGKIDTSSSTYSFQGTGFLQTFIETDSDSNTYTNFISKTFKFKGVRNSQNVYSSTSTTSS